MDKENDSEKKDTQKVPGKDPEVERIHEVIQEASKDFLSRQFKAIQESLDSIDPELRAAGYVEPYCEWEALCTDFREWKKHGEIKTENWREILAPRSTERANKIMLALGNNGYQILAAWDNHPAFYHDPETPFDPRIILIGQDPQEPIQGVINVLSDSQFDYIFLGHTGFKKPETQTRVYCIGDQKSEEEVKRLYGEAFDLHLKVRRTEGNLTQKSVVRRIENMVKPRESKELSFEGWNEVYNQCMKEIETEAGNCGEEWKNACELWLKAHHKKYSKIISGIREHQTTEHPYSMLIFLPPEGVLPPFTIQEYLKRQRIERLTVLKKRVDYGRTN